MFKLYDIRVEFERGAWTYIVAVGNFKFPNSVFV